MNDEHFEGWGNFWQNLYPDPEQGIKLFPEIIQNGTVCNNCHITNTINETALIQNPGDGDVRLGALLSKENKNEPFEFYSAYPILKGKLNEMTVESTSAWQNDIEGEVSAAVEDGVSLTFFAPFYFRDFSKFIPGQKMDIEISGFASQLQQVVISEFTVEEGPFYEHMLQEFLVENPDKTKTDFAAPVISTNGSTIFYPADIKWLYQFQTPVESVEKISVLDLSFFKLGAISHRFDAGNISYFIYVPEHLLNGYEPMVGDDIEGMVWLMGQIVGD